jgi:hypothetical protein
MAPMIPTLITQRKRLWTPDQAPPIALRPYAYKLDSGRLGMSAPGATAIVAQADESRMGIPAIISTVDRDRVGDEVPPELCDLTNYRLNPAVFFGHQSDPIPVGHSDYPARSGNLFVTVNPGRDMTAWCFFQQATPEGMQYFLLVKEGVLRGTSIGFNPLEEPEKLDEKPGNLYAGFRFRRWELLEWSWCGVPMNPKCGTMRSARPSGVNAGTNDLTAGEREELYQITQRAALVRSYLSAGKIAGEPISPRMRKSLEPLAVPERTWATGAPGFSGFKAKEIPMSAKTILAASKLLALVPEDKQDAAAALVKEMGESSGTEGGYTANADDDAAGDEPAADEHGEIKSALRGVMAKHKEADPEMKLHYQPAGKAVHHQYAKEDEEHLDAVKADVEGVEGVKAFSRSKAEPEEEGYEDVGSEDAAPEKPAGDETHDPAGDDIKRLETRLAKLKAAKAKKKKDAEGIAVADAEPGDSPTDPEDAEPADDLPHGAQVVQGVIEHLESALGQAEPETKPYFEEMLEDCREWATDRYPDVDFGEGESKEEASYPDEDAADAAAEQDAKNDEEEITDSIMDSYRQGKPQHAKRLIERLVKRMNKRHKAILRDATDHMGDMSDLEPGTKFTRTHKAACKAHHGAMKSMLREMDTAGATGEGGNEGIGDAGAGADEEHSLDMAAVGKALHEVGKQAAERKAASEQAFFRLTGKRA